MAVIAVLLQVDPDSGSSCGPVGLPCFMAPIRCWFWRILRLARLFGQAPYDRRIQLIQEKILADPRYHFHINPSLCPPCGLCRRWTKSLHACPREASFSCLARRAFSVGKASACA
jgi:ferredoxin